MAHPGGVGAARRAASTSQGPTQAATWPEQQTGVTAADDRRRSSRGLHDAVHQSRPHSWMTKKKIAAAAPGMNAARRTAPTQPRQPTAAASASDHGTYISPAYFARAASVSRAARPGAIAADVTRVTLPLVSQRGTAPSAIVVESKTARWDWKITEPQTTKAAAPE